MNNSEITGLIKANPRPERGRPKTIARRNLLKSNPGEWFLWKENSKTGGDSGQALRTLVGLTTLTNVDRKALAYQAMSQVNENGTYNVFVRYVGEKREYVN